MSKKRKVAVIDLSGDDHTTTKVVYRNRKRRTNWKQRARDFKNYIAGAQGSRGSAGSKAFWGEDYASGTDFQKALRKGVGFRGKGDYKDWLPKIAKWGLRLGGAAAGGLVGSVSGNPWGGAKAGWDSGAEVSKYYGYGDYGGDAGGNQLMAGSMETPMMVNQNPLDLSGDIYVCKREFMANVVGIGSGTSVMTSPFHVQSFSLNPGLLQTFPWLSQVASNFTLYEFAGMIFEYVPTSGEIGSISNQLGKVIMATQYDPDAPEFASSIEMENYDYSNSCKPSEHMKHGVETERKQSVTNMLYTRTGGTTKDLVFTDLGLFQIATEGLPTGGADVGVSFPVGELYVSYCIKLSRARLNAALGDAIPFDYFLLTGSSASAVASVQPLSTNTLGTTISGISANRIVITFPISVSYGTYHLHIHLPVNQAAVNTFWDSASVIQTTTNCNVYRPFGPLNGTAPNATCGFWNLNSVGVTTNVIIAFDTWINVTAPGSQLAQVVCQLDGNIAGTYYIGIDQVNPKTNIAS